MIILFNDKFNTFDKNHRLSELQEFYDNNLKDLNYHSLTCPCCHSKGVMSIHAYYQRGLKVGSDNDLIKLTIQRVICDSCGTSHALLPSCIVPYSHFSVHVQINIIYSSLLVSDHSMKIFYDFCNYFQIFENNIQYIVKKFNKYWKERLSSIPIKLNDNKLLELCHSYFKFQFMQIRTTPTIAYIGNHIRCYD